MHTIQQQQQSIVVVYVDRWSENKFLRLEIIVFIPGSIDRSIHPSIPTDQTMHCYFGITEFSSQSSVVAISRLLRKILTLV